MDEQKIKVEKKTSWLCPHDYNQIILSGPNLPKPLHGVNPRTFMGSVAWGKTRKRTYYLAKYKCQICGADCSESGSMDAHELYDIDYVKGTSTFKRVVGICKNCHNFYHSGRLITLYRRRNPLYPSSKVLSIVEHGFQVIYKWNQAHPDEPKLKAYETFLEYLKHDELSPKMEELIEKYEIEFWGEDKKKLAEWGDWKLVFGNREYPTPYKDYVAWEEAMKEASRNDNVRKINSPFTGGVYDEILETLKKEI